MQKLGIVVRSGLVLIDPHANNLEELLSQVIQRAVDQGIVSEAARGVVLQNLRKRASASSVAIGHGVSIPHTYVEGVTKPTVIFVRLRRPLQLVATDEEPTRFVYVLVGPPGNVDVHLDTLASIARATADKELRYDLGQCDTVEEVIQSFEDYGRRHTPTPEREPKGLEAGLVYTGQLCGGLIRDVHRRLPSYVSDFRDGVHVKTITATLFLFFACLAPAVTFGGLMFAETGGQIGATEMLVATAISGIAYALLAGQPLIILGGTGPLLIFTGILYQLCQTFEVPFLSSYAWVGIWTAAFTILLAITDASCLIRSFTRFTDEIFAALISLIFIAEALKSIFGYVREARQEELAHDIAFLSLLMALGTFIVATVLSRFRKSRYLVMQAREFLADFGPTLAVVSMIVFGLLFPAIKLHPLEVPETFATTTGRGWLISLTDAPMWIWVAAAGPAFLATLLIYLDQNITARLVNSPDHALTKGEGYHLDLCVVGVLVGVCSILGLPWLVAATVRSLNQVRALATVEERILPSGDRRDEIVHVQENRLTPLAVHILIGASLFLLPALRLVPRPVLYGLFLYMGIVSIAGNQLFERVGLWMMDSKLYPRTHYMRNVPVKTIHQFTLLQVVCLAILWIIKTSAVAILFPLFIALLVPIRMLSARYFAAEHLAALDAEEVPDEESSDWAG